MYTIDYIKELSDKMEAGEITPSVCLTSLNTLQRERLELKQRAEAILTERYIIEANKRKVANWSEERAEIVQMWRDTYPLTNEKLKENLKHTKAYQNGLISDVKLNALDIYAAPKFTDLLKQFEWLLQ
jgi:hypothetical protein